MPKGQGNSRRPGAVDQTRMSFGDHLEELRHRMLLSLAGLGGGLAVALFFADDIIALLCQPLLVALAMEGLNPRVYQEQVQGLFINYLQAGLLAGLIIASPWVFYQLWKFVAAGLYRHERRFVKTFAPASLGLFLLGAAFVYFFVLPLGLRFFVEFNRIIEPPSLRFQTPVQRFIYRDADGPPATTQADAADTALPVLPVLDAPPPADSTPDGVVWIDRVTGQVQYYHRGKVKSLPPTARSMVEPWFNLADYLKFALVLMFVFGLGFQMPLVILFLARTGIVTTDRMRRARRGVVMTLVILAAVFTPPDVISQILLGGCMYALFELGLLLGRRAERRNAA